MNIGVAHTLTGDRAGITGGQSNTNRGVFSAIGGGIGNAIETGADASTMGGGDGNSIATGADHSVIGGGERNTIHMGEYYSTIGGGSSNASGGVFATIGGGSVNTAAALAATVGGGSYNSAIDSYATVPGGFGNSAGGAYSFAAGRSAQAYNQGAFVWSDASSAVDFVSTRNNEFSIRARGGVRVDTGSGPGISLSAADTPLITRGWDAFDVTAPVAKQGHGRWGLFMENFRLAIGIPDLGDRYFEIAKYATDGTSTPLLTLDQGGNLRTTTGAIGIISDRNLKTDFAPVDGREILEHLIRVPIQTWRFKDHPAKQRHLGPMAQDFHAAFGVGLDERSICTVDADGVALAAIQGLNQKLEDQAREKDGRIAELERRLAAVEALLKSSAK